MDLDMGGGLLSPKSYVDVPTGPQKSASLYTNFAQFPTQQYTIFERKASNYFDQIGCFLQEFALNTPNLCNLGYFVLRYTKFRENAP